ncbi:PAS domain S-box protein [Phenylobacterium sp.]|uniref:PAS domain S-box protein n=1 Tax=Phenylobacterium sp. TaxID=1871053 RepID=UPI002FD94936
MMTETSASDPPAGDRPASAPDAEAAPAGAAPAGQALLSLRLQHFDRAQAVTKTGSWEWDLQTNLIVWSDQVYRIFGLEPGDIEPSFPRFLARVHPDDRPEVEATIQRAVSGQAWESLEHRIITPGGEVRAVRQVGVITSDAQGRPTQMTGAITDVTEQRRVLDEHRETRQMLDSLLRGSPEAIVVTNGAGEILIFSAGAEAMFGYRSAEMEGQPVEALLPEAVREVHRRHVQAFAAEPGDTLLMHQRTEIRGRRRNGETFPAEASLKKLTTRGGHIFTAIVRDLTQVRAAEQRLVEAREQAERANRAKSSFLANMSHEIRTPLNGVLGITGALARTGLSPAQAEMVALIETSGKALEGLLSDILDLAKVEAGFIEIHDAPLDLARVLHETASLFQARAADKGLLIQVQLTCEVGATFRGDELRIRQVLSNLVSNAIKFTKAGEVRLSLACAQGEEDQTLVTFTVTDTGIGFDPELGSQLFERFEQGDASITRKFGHGSRPRHLQSPRGPHGRVDYGAL